MNTSKFLEQLNNTYKLDFKIEHQQGYYYKIKCSYLDVIDFYISFRYDVAIPDIQNLYLISKVIEAELLKFFYKE